MREHQQKRADCGPSMAATILTFKRLSRGRVADQHCGESAVRATLMSVPEAAFEAFFLSSPPRDPVEVISQLTGINVCELRSAWGGPGGLREAGVRFALSMAMG
jgi:hypothetical protein